MSFGDLCLFLGALFAFATLILKVAESAAAGNLTLVSHTKAYTMNDQTALTASSHKFPC